MNNEFDKKALEWDKNPMHRERSIAIAKDLVEMLPLKSTMRALEFGAGTGILSFLLKDHLQEIVMMDSSQEMVKIMNDKVIAANATKLHPLYFDLQHQHLLNEKFDIIFTQMVLHHINDLDSIFDKWHSLLNPNGYLVIADIYTEDGSFHDASFTGHYGFDLNELTNQLTKHNFINQQYKTSYTIKRDTGDGSIKEFPIFILVSKSN